jgi:hypothetical protein
MKAGTLALLGIGGYLLLSRQQTPPSPYGHYQPLSPLGEFLARLGVNPQVTQAVTPAAQTIIPAAAGGLLSLISSGVRALFSPSTPEGEAMYDTPIGPIMYDAPVQTVMPIPDPEYWVPDLTYAPDPEYVVSPVPAYDGEWF